MDYNQAQQIVTQAIGIMSVDDKPTLIDMLQRNGVMVSDQSTQEEVLNSTFMAIKDSAKFRNELTDYFTEQASTDDEDSSGNFSNKDGKGKKAVSDFLKTLFSEENVNKGLGIGMDYLGSKLQANAQKGVGKQAIELESLKAQTAANEALKIDALSKLPSTTDKPKKWILPVAIGGGVLILGVVLYFVLRKK
jgi:hypothetical protein